MPTRAGETRQGRLSYKKLLYYAWVTCDYISRKISPQCFPDYPCCCSVSSVSQIKDRSLFMWGGGGWGREIMGGAGPIRGGPKENFTMIGGGSLCDCEE